jgi:hypothetical protein
MPYTPAVTEGRGGKASVGGTGGWRPSCEVLAAIPPNSRCARRVVSGTLARVALLCRIELVPARRTWHRNPAMTARREDAVDPIIGPK